MRLIFESSFNTPITKRHRPAASLLLRSHPIDVADANPIAPRRDRPLRVIARLRPCPWHAEGS